MVSVRWCCAWLIVVSACGGNVEGGSGGPDPDPQPDVEAETSPGKTGSSSDPVADTALGACKLGRAEDWRAPCPWVTDGRCYEEREMACNCACPRSRDSQCNSGFEDGPDGHVWVSCN